MISQNLLIASGNKGKIQEIKEILSSLKLEFFTPKSLGISINIEETGNSYGENAHLKAEAYSRFTGMAVLADDSGLEVDALNGAPGIISARYSTKENADDLDRRLHLLSNLQGTPQPWKAHFHCTAVFLSPEGDHFETVGRCDGEIIAQMRGTGGFGYDPIFFLPAYKKTMAELPSTVKNTVSHRAKALTKMMPYLQSYLNTQ